MSTTSVVWFRRDLRLSDHPALHAALAEGAVVPLFVIDPAFAGAGINRRAFLAAALRSLDDSLRQRTGAGLVVRTGAPGEVVPTVALECHAATVFVTRDHSPYGRQRDREVGEALHAAGHRLMGVGSNYAVDPGTVRKGDGTAYAVFTPFSRAWRSCPRSGPLPTPELAGGRVRAVPGEQLPVAPATRASAPFGSGSPFDDADEAAALDRWREFLPAVSDYGAQRNLPAIDGTSRLSASLRWGVLHPRQMLADLERLPGVDERGAGAHTFVNELVWREFYADVLLRHPDTARANLNRAMDRLVVDTDGAARQRFARWTSGTTGYPVVDAAMRQLLGTGWMHNRLRMIAASFLVKDLHLPWQWGARHFMRHLVDGDLASNSHGWQWTAGTGTDAAPYFRVFNPTAQGERFDPEGDFVRRWVPELSGIGGIGVHDPGVLRPEDYPPPMVDHAAERAEALRRYAASR